MLFAINVFVNATLFSYFFFSNYLLQSTATGCSTGFYQVGVTTNVNFSLCMMGRPIREWKYNSISALGKVKVKGIHPRTDHECLEGE